MGGGGRKGARGEGRKLGGEVAGLVLAGLGVSRLALRHGFDCVESAHVDAGGGDTADG